MLLKNYVNMYIYTLKNIRKNRAQCTDDFTCILNFVESTCKFSVFSEQNLI